MGGPRGGSFIILHAYEYNLLRKLGAELEEDAEMMSRYYKALGGYREKELCDRLCGEAAAEILKRHPNASGLKASADASMRGRNYYDYSIRNDNVRFFIEIKMRQSGSPKPYTEFRIHFGDLFSLLSEKIPVPDREAYACRWDETLRGLEKFMQGEDDRKESELADSARTLVWDMAEKMQECGSGLTETLWNYFYCGPIYRVTFTDDSVSVDFFGEFGNPNDEGEVLSPAPSGVGLQASQGAQSMKIRFLTTPAKTPANVISAAVSFGTAKPVLTTGTDDDL